MRWLPSARRRLATSRWSQARRVAPSLRLHLYQGTADGTVPIAHLALLTQALPQATVRRLEGRDHQLGDDLTKVAEDLRRMG